MERQELIELVRVRPGEKVRLKDMPTCLTHTPDLKELSKQDLKSRAKEILERDLAELSKAQEVLYADDRFSLLIILQAMDAAGKDGTIKHVMSGVNPQGCQVFSFKQPSAEELDHSFLWRCMKAVPERGRIGIFNRSYYEEVLVVRVHPEFLDLQKLPPGKRDKNFWGERYEDIRNFERHLTRNGTVILKFFLHVSKDEQKKRFLERLADPNKHWKFSTGDVTERGYWKDYMNAYEEALEATATDWAPWYVVPADHKWVTRAMVANIITQTLRSLPLKYPEVSPEKKKLLAEAKRSLEKD